MGHVTGLDWSVPTDISGNHDASILNVYFKDTRPATLQLQFYHNA